MKETEDRRPAPKPRKLIHLWQMYLMWNELVEMRKRHTLRIDSIKAGKSNMNESIERAFIEGMNLDVQIKSGKVKHTFTVDGKEVTISVYHEGYRDKMIATAEIYAGPIFAWVTSIRGLREGSLAAQLLAQIDDISKFATVSKLWRFAGLAVIDGQAEYNKRGEVSHYNRRLKSILWLITDQFIKQQTPLYVDIYYEEKERLHGLYPEKVKIGVTKDGKAKYKYSDAHLHNMARRKAAKIFLQHLWVKWRELEGLPVSQPYVQAFLHHADIIEVE